MNAVTSASHTPAARTAGRVPVAGLIGGAVLVATLGAGAGWLIHGDQARREAEVPAAAMVASTPAPVVAQATPTPPAATAPVQAAPAHPARRAPVERPAPQASVASAEAAPTPLPTRRVAVCATCGEVESVRPVQQAGQPSGLGAIAGGVLGGVLGNQVGKGGGRTAMTVLGAVGGGYAGHEIEKRTRTETTYQVRIRMDDGTMRTVTRKQPPAVGTRVSLDGSGELRDLPPEPSAGRDAGVMQTGDRGSF